MHRRLDIIMSGMRRAPIMRITSSNWTQHRMQAAWYGTAVMEARIYRSNHQYHAAVRAPAPMVFSSLHRLDAPKPWTIDVLFRRAKWKVLCFENKWNWNRHSYFQLKRNQSICTSVINSSIAHKSNQRVKQNITDKAFQSTFQMKTHKSHQPRYLLPITEWSSAPTTAPS